MLRQDGAVHFGDLLQLAHAPSGGVLAANTYDHDVPGTAAAAGSSGGACAASLTGGQAAATAPMARNTLLLSRYAPLRPSPLQPQWDGDQVRYGQRLLVVANPEARGEPLDAAGGSEPLYLASEPLGEPSTRDATRGAPCAAKMRRLACVLKQRKLPFWHRQNAQGRQAPDCQLVPQRLAPPPPVAAAPAGPTCAARYSRHQAVFWTPCPAYACVWVPQPLDPALRGTLEGTPVAPGAPLLLVHAATGAPLAWEGGSSFPTDYGPEHEVSAHAATAAGMQQGLEHAARVRGVASCAPQRCCSGWGSEYQGHASQVHDGGSCVWSSTPPCLLHRQAQCRRTHCAAAGLPPA